MVVLNDKKEALSETQIKTCLRRVLSKGEWSNLTSADRYRLVEEYYEKNVLRYGGTVHQTVLKRELLQFLSSQCD